MLATDKKCSVSADLLIDQNAVGLYVLYTLLSALSHVLLPLALFLMSFAIQK